MKTFGYAAEPIAARLARRGGIPAAEAQGFAVMDTKGPQEGEIERAAAWGRHIAAAVSTDAP
jgi:hypothetical protein